MGQTGKRNTVFVNVGLNVYLSLVFIIIFFISFYLYLTVVFRNAK